MNHYTQTEATLPQQKGSRQAMTLDGVWDFSYAGTGAELDGEGHTIQVPGVWQAQFQHLRNSIGTGTYRRSVTIPSTCAGSRLFLIFEGIFHHATIAIDGKVIAAHRNAWTPIEIEVSDLVSAKATFDLEVKASVPDDRNYQTDGMSTALLGKQDWYGLQGGIWKSVRLEARHSRHIAKISVRAETDLVTHLINVSGNLSGDGKAKLLLTLGDTAQQSYVVDADFSISLPIEKVNYWSPAKPNLYELRIALMEGDETIDEVTRTIGFRRFESRDRKLWLNGEPFYMFGALDQDWYPETECIHPNLAFLEQRFVNAKALGLNTLRCHVKIPDPLYFELADKHGLVVWLDMPYMEFLAPQTRTQLSETFEAAVANHGHHPAICIWTIINEGWGIDLDDNPSDRHWLLMEFDRLKQLVPQSALVDNSPCFPRNYHLRTEIEDFHWYNSWPSQNQSFQKTTEEFSARAPWAWSPHGDAHSTGREPLIVSEFGVWGLPYPKDILERDGSEPWWFQSGHDWNNGCGFPHGMETRFRDARLAALFGSLDGFVAAAQQTQYRGLKFQIETLRNADAISGYVITELNDTKWEANGLLDARNNIREFGPLLASLQTPWLIVAWPTRTVLHLGETIDVPMRLTGVGTLPGGATLKWQFGAANGELMFAATTGTPQATITISAPANPVVLSLELEAMDGDGQILSRNSVEFCVLADIADAPLLFPADTAAADLLKKMGWPAIAAVSANATTVATRLTTPLRQQLLVGDKVLLIANEANALIDPERDLPYSDLVNFPKMQLREREGSPWDGRWMGAFSWRRTDGPWASLPNGPMLDEHWIGLLPKYILTGFRSTAFDGLVDAGMAVGWLHKAAAFSKRSFLGRGWLTVTTFDLTSSNAASNPLAALLLRALVKS